MVVVKAIARVPKNSQDKPLEDVVLKKVTIVREGQPMPPLPKPPLHPQRPRQNHNAYLTIRGELSMSAATRHLCHVQHL